MVHLPFPMHHNLKMRTLQEWEEPGTDGTFTNFHSSKNWERFVCPQPSHRRVAHTTRFSLCGEFSEIYSLTYADFKFILTKIPTQAKPGLEWPTRQWPLCTYRNFKVYRALE
jgi:hypothetical protein